MESYGVIKFTIGHNRIWSGLSVAPQWQAGVNFVCHSNAPDYVSPGQKPFDDADKSSFRSKFQFLVCVYLEIGP